MKNESKLEFSIECSPAILSTASFLAFGVTIELGKNEDKIMQALYHHGLLWLVEELQGDAEVKAVLAKIGKEDSKIAKHLQETTVHFLASRFLLKHGGLIGFNDLCEDHGNVNRADSLDTLHGEGADNDLEDMISKIFETAEGHGKPNVGVVEIDASGNFKTHGAELPDELRSILEGVFGSKKSDKPEPATKDN